MEKVLQPRAVVESLFLEGLKIPVDVALGNVGLAVLGSSMVLKIFSDLNDSIIL